MSEIKTNYTIENSVKINSLEDNIVITGLTYNNVSYYELGYYADKIGKSVKTLRRKMSKVDKENSSLYFIRVMNKLYVSDAIKDLGKPVKKEKVLVLVHDIILGSRYELKDM